MRDFGMVVTARYWLLFVVVAQKSCITWLIHAKVVGDRVLCSLALPLSPVPVEKVRCDLWRKN